MSFDYISRLFIFMPDTDVFYPESAIRFPFLFRAAVSRIVSCFIEDVAGYTGKKQDTIWLTAVRKKDKELIINLKRIIGGLMRFGFIIIGNSIN